MLSFHGDQIWFKKKKKKIRQKRGWTEKLSRGYNSSVTATEFTGGTENAGLSTGEASLQNKRVTVSFPTKTWSTPSCCFPQCPWGNGTSIPHRMVLCWQPVSLSPLLSTTRWDWCPGGGTGTTTRVSTAWAGLSSPHHATWPAACPLPGTDPCLEKEEMREEHWDLVQKEQHNPQNQYWDRQTILRPANTILRYWKRNQMSIDWRKCAPGRRHLWHQPWTPCPVWVCPPAPPLFQGGFFIQHSL